VKTPGGPKKALSKVFRARYVAALRTALPGQSKSFFQSLFKKPWVVYAKRPFGGPEQVIEYLGRYTHKIAISNHRITSMEDQSISFRYKDYRQQGVNKTMTLDAIEFIRRFSMHILPKGFVRIRHYGMLSNALKPATLPILREQLMPGISYESLAKPEVVAVPLVPVCPCCKKGMMQHLMDFDHRGPPIDLVRLLLNDKNHEPIQTTV
jgi:hypothetical protein